MMTKRVADPSREDAVRMTRSERIAMIVLAHAATVFEDLQEELKDRLKMIPDGAERLREVSEKTDALLFELRPTIPMKQRESLSNVALDMEMRIVPKNTPSETSVVMTKDEFRELVDLARVQCRECVMDTEECEKCSLFQLLTAVLPMEDYNGWTLCPYNLGEWAN